MRALIASLTLLSLSVQGLAQGTLFSSLPTLATPDIAADFVLVLDVSDTAIAPTGRGKKTRLDVFSTILTPTWANIASKPTTLAGFGITDGQPLDSDLTAIAALTTTAFARGILDDADGTAARLTIGAVIGTNVQAWDADLDTFAGITIGANVATFLATPSSANFAAAITGETGSGAAVFAVSPALTGTPTAPTASAGTNTTQLATTAYVDDASVSVVDPAADKFLGWDDSASAIKAVDHADLALVLQVANGGTATATPALVAGTNVTITGTWPNNTINATAGTGDMLATLTAAEISVTGAVTATISRMHVASGTAADYTITLPAASGNTGKLIGFRMADALTRFVTLDGNASETINGATTRIMWSGESAILLCDGSNWSKIAGVAKPLAAIISRGTNQTGVVTGTETDVTFDTTDYDPSTRMVTLPEIIIRRAGRYQVQGSVAVVIATTAAPRVISAPTQNNVNLRTGEQFGAIGGVPTPLSTSPYTLAVDDVIGLELYQDSGNNQTVIGQAVSPTFLPVIELIPW